MNNYENGRVANSEWCPIFPLDDETLVDKMTTYAKENLNDGKDIYIVCNSGKRGAEKATSVLRNANINSTSIYTVEGGAKALSNIKGALNTDRTNENIDWKYVSGEDTVKEIGKNNVQFLDVRDDDTYNQGHIEGSFQSGLKNFDSVEAQEKMYNLATNKMSKDKPVYILCYSGNKCAKTAISVMKDAGFDTNNLFIIENGAKNADVAKMFVTGNDENINNDNVKAVDKRTVYVTPQWLKSAMDKKQPGYENLIIAEVSYGDVKDCKSYNEGHIVGAQYIDDCEVEDATGSPEGAYNILPASEVEKNILSHGITKDTKVVLYGQDAAGVGRVAYAYLWAGVEDVKILNGGIELWKKAGYETETKLNKGEAVTDFKTTVPAKPEYYTSIEEAKDRLENDSDFKLVSIRSEDEWLGKTSGYNYMDKAGEPEGAVWGKGAKTAFDVAEFTNSDGTIKDLDGLKEVWKDCEFTLDNHLAFYCGTGWRATVPFLVLYENGYNNISVYDGGWYEWLMHDDFPVQVGDPKNENCIHTTVGELPTGKAAK